jgi:hypothetical protein
MQLAKGVQTLGRRVVTQAKNVRPARGKPSLLPT